MNPTINGPRHDRSTTTATLHPPGADWDASFDEPVAAQVSRRATRGRVAFWLLAALALIVAALAQASLAVFLAGTVVAGIAVGGVFLGSLATASRLAPPARRGQVISTYFVACYAGLIIPVVGVGVASGFIGDFQAVLALSVLLAVLCLFALVRVGRTAAPDGTAVTR